MRYIVLLSFVLALLVPAPASAASCTSEPYATTTQKCGLFSKKKNSTTAKKAKKSKRSKKSGKRSKAKSSS